jgi:hypothetical protein
MTCVVSAMYIDSFAYDDSFAVYEFNDRINEDGSFRGSRRSMFIVDTVENDHSESTVANFSCSSFNSIHFDDNCDEFVGTVPSEEMKSTLKATIDQKKKTRFAGVTVREYTVVVGCQDISCPLELDWEYVEYDFTREEDYRVNSEPRAKIRPLSYQERKQIIAVSQEVSIAHVKYLEQEMLHLQENNFESKNIFDPECKRGIKRIDSPPRLPRSDTKTTPSTTTTISTNNGSTTANDALLIGFNSNRNDSPPRRPSNSYD